MSFADVRTARRYARPLGNLARVVRLEDGFGVLELPPSKGLPAVLRTGPKTHRRVTAAEGLKLTLDMIPTETPRPGRPALPEADRLAPVTVWLNERHLAALDAVGERSVVLRTLVDGLLEKSSRSK